MLKSILDWLVRLTGGNKPQDSRRTDNDIPVELESQPQNPKIDLLQDYELEVISLTDQGGRGNNEDSEGVQSFSAQILLCATADGLGGYAGGEYASGIAIKTIMDYFREYIDLETPEQLLKNSFERANQAIVDKTLEDPMIERMRTTAVALFIKQGLAYWAHVGDSRMYHVRNGVIQFQTQDHSVVQLLVNTGEITPSEMRGHPDRNRLLKVMGSHDEFRVAYQSEGIPIQKGDFFVLCSDGFWDLVTEADMTSALLVANDLLVGKELLSKAISLGQGNFDNITLQIVHVK